MENFNLQRGFQWVCKTIETCTNPLQLEAAERLLENFQKNNADEGIKKQVYYKFQQKALELNYYGYKEVN